MGLIAGFVLLAVTIAMVTIARPGDGVSAPFLRVWIVGQVYVLVAMVSAVIGVTFLITNAPF